MARGKRPDPSNPSDAQNACPNHNTPTTTPSATEAPSHETGWEEPGEGAHARWEKGKRQMVACK
eukprot:3766315-Alexandrium_andersonii.AAC.1